MAIVYYYHQYCVYTEDGFGCKDSYLKLHGIRDKQYRYSNIITTVIVTEYFENTANILHHIGSLQYVDIYTEYSDIDQWLRRLPQILISL